MKKLSTAVFLLACATALPAQTPPDVSAIYPDLEKLYIDLHQTPELSRQEVKTAAKLAERFRRLGYEVT